MKANCTAVLNRRVKVVKFTDRLTIGELKAHQVLWDAGYNQWTVNGYVVREGAWLLTDSTGNVHILPEDTFEELCHE